MKPVDKYLVKFNNTDTKSNINFLVFEMITGFYGLFHATFNIVTSF